MKTQLSLTEMATELARRNDAKRDFIADTRQLVALPGAAEKASPRIELQVPVGQHVDTLTLEPGDTFRRQVSSHFRIPFEYAERVRAEHPDLWVRTLNTHLHREPSRRMVRVLDSRARAFLSDRFRPLDNFDLAEAVLPELLSKPDLRIESTALTESRFHIKAVFPKIETEVKVGDPVQIGIAIANSEVGASSLSVFPLIYRLVCKNGLISEDFGHRRYHVGKRASAEEAAYELYTDRTKALDDAAFFAKVKDTVHGVLTREVLEKLVSKMREATEQKIEGTNIPGVVEVTARKFGYSETTKAGILTHLIQGGDLTRYGLMNAITRQAQDEEDYETATRMEADGARIIELPRTDWKVIGDAALAKAA